MRYVMMTVYVCASALCAHHLWGPWGGLLILFLALFIDIRMDRDL